MADGERGFTLIELAVTLAIVALVSLVSVGLLAALAQRGEAGVDRALAMMVAQNTLERARVAAAYLPLITDPAQDAAGKARAASGDVSYIIAPASSFVAQARLPASACPTIALAVTTELSGTNVFRVSVRYPRSACVPAVTDTVELSEVLPAPVPIPGSRVYQPLAGEPAVQ